MSNIFFGNTFSLAASVFLCLSAAASGRRETYLFQVGECAFLLVAQLFFGQLGAAAVMIFSIVRNLLLTFDKYNNAWMLVLFVFTGYFGLKINTGGVVGLIPVIATMVYTLSSKLAKSRVNVKIALLLNLFLWVAYSFLIKDYVTAGMNSLAAVLALISLFARARSTCEK